MTFPGRVFRRHKHLLFGRARFTNEASRRQYTCGHVTARKKRRRKGRANLTWKSTRREGEFLRCIVAAPGYTRSVDGDFRRDEAEAMAMDAGAAVKVSGNMTFAMQIGLVREAVTVTVEGGAGDLTMATLKDIACAFVDRKVRRLFCEDATCLARAGKCELVVWSPAGCYITMWVSATQ